HRHPPAGLQATMNTVMSSGARRKVTLERTFQASMEEVWDLWTTKEGIESWWGPGGIRCLGAHARSSAGGGRIRVRDDRDRPRADRVLEESGDATDERGPGKLHGRRSAPAARVYAPRRLHSGCRAVRRDDRR